MYGCVKYISLLSALINSYLCTSLCTRHMSFQPDILYFLEVQFKKHQEASNNKSNN